MCLRISTTDVSPYTTTDMFRSYLDHTCTTAFWLPLPGPHTDSVESLDFAVTSYDPPPCRR